MNNFLQTLKQQLPNISIRSDFTLAPFTWLRVGGKAKYFYKPKNVEELQKVLTIKPDNLPVFVMGVGSNLLVRDGGIDALVIKLSSKFSEIKQLNDNLIYAGASALMPNVALFCLEKNLTNLEFLYGIPGTVGGGVKMNAGAYQSEHVNVLKSIVVIDENFKQKELKVDDLDYSYRHSNISDSCIVIGAYYKVKTADKEKIEQKMNFIKESREKSQPVKVKTSGSTFANPKEESAWKLIDKVGGRGLSINDAQFSTKHCNFLINKNNATASDLEQLGEVVRKKVKTQFDIDLKWEVKKVGNPL